MITIDCSQVDYGGDHEDDVDPDDQQGHDEAGQTDPHPLQSSFGASLLQISLLLQNEDDQEGLGMVIVMTRFVRKKVRTMITSDAIKLLVAFVDDAE